MNSKNKYLKYKNKYKKLKTQLGGSNNQITLPTFLVLENSGVPPYRYNKNRIDYQNQCLYISILDYFYYIRKTPPIYDNDINYNSEPYDIKRFRDFLKLQNTTEARRKDFDSVASDCAGRPCYDRIVYFCKLNNINIKIYAKNNFLSKDSILGNGIIETFPYASNDVGRDDINLLSHSTFVGSGDTGHFELIIYCNEYGINELSKINISMVDDNVQYKEENSYWLEDPFQLAIMNYDRTYKTLKLRPYLLSLNNRGVPLDIATTQQLRQPGTQQLIQTNIDDRDYKSGLSTIPQLKKNSSFKPKQNKSPTLDELFLLIDNITNEIKQNNCDELNNNLEYYLNEYKNNIKNPNVKPSIIRNINISINKIKNELIKNNCNVLINQLKDYERQLNKLLNSNNHTPKLEKSDSQQQISIIVADTPKLEKSDSQQQISIIVADTPKLEKSDSQQQNSIIVADTPKLEKSDSQQQNSIIVADTPKLEKSIIVNDTIKLEKSDSHQIPINIQLIIICNNLKTELEEVEKELIEHKGMNFSIENDRYIEALNKDIEIIKNELKKYGC